jgi:outer membrane protein TolC
MCEHSSVKRTFCRAYGTDPSSGRVPSVETQGYHRMSLRHRPNAHPLTHLFAFFLTGLAGCQLFVDDADRQVYKLIEQRERQATGLTPDSKIDKEYVPQPVPKSAYKHVPSATQSAIPPAMEAKSPPSTEPLEAPTSQAVLAPASRPGPVTRLNLRAALAFAFANSRDFQSAKEDLYLSALALTLERHLWGPIFLANLKMDYANYGEVRHFDHAMAAVANAAVQQRLPYGGQVTATVINTLMRDLGRQITSKESGQAIIDANLPLLRGAGTVAQEPLYQAERNLVYATRSFEFFRQVYAVRVAVAYFELIRLKQRIINARSSYASFYGDSDRSTALFKAGRVIELEAQRAQQSLLTSWNQVVDSEEQYRLALDAFKILIGMTTTEPLDVRADEEADLAVPKMEENVAIQIALENRLDLINYRDAIDDAHRRVNVAQNALLPDLNLRTNITWDTNPLKLDQFDYNSDRTTWRAGMDLSVPIDRVKERNDYRAALIDVRRAQRQYELSADNVRLQVRQAKRDIDLALTSLSIQQQSIELARRQREAADFRFQRGLISNREVVDAENNLLSARDAVAAAQSRLRQAILAFYRDTGMIRADDAGQLLDPVAPKR